MSENPDEPQAPPAQPPETEDEEFHLEPPEYHKVREGGDWKPVAGDGQAAE